MVNHYDFDKCTYRIGDLDNNLYLYPYDTSTINYITDNNELNARAVSIEGDCYRLYCNAVNYSSESSADNRFFFTNVLEAVINEENSMTFHKVLERLITEKWYVVFKNKEQESFILNAEFPCFITYTYQFTDGSIGNLCTIDFNVNQNIPTVYLNTAPISNYVFRDKSCDYNVGKITSLRMMSMLDTDIKSVDDRFDIIKYEDDAIKDIQFLDGTLTFTDEYNGETYSQTLSFNIPFEHYKFYFHYNLLEYLDNRYYCVVKTTNGNHLLGGFRQGMFPSYTISTSEDTSSPNVITITLKAVYSTYSLLVDDTVEEVKGEARKQFKEVVGQCVNGTYLKLLLQEVNTNNYYCMSGYESYFSDYNIVGSYTQFDTSFGMKLYDPSFDCSQFECSIDGLPQIVYFQKIGEIKRYLVTSNCALSFASDCVETVYDTTTHILTLISKINQGTCTLTASTIDNSQLITVIVDPNQSEYEQTIRIDAREQDINVILNQPLSNVFKIQNDCNLNLIPNSFNNGYMVHFNANTSTTEYITCTIIAEYNDGTNETIHIIQNHLYETYLNDGTKQCDGDNLWLMVHRYIGYDEFDISIDGGYVKLSMEEEDSLECLGTPTATTKEGTACYGGILYDLMKYEFASGKVVRKAFPSEVGCLEDDYSKWEINRNSYICVNGVPYYKEFLYLSNDNVTWYLTTKFRASSEEADNSLICEAIVCKNGETTLYRWNETQDTICLTDASQINCMNSETIPFNSGDSSTYLCENGKLYEKVRNSVSYKCNGLYQVYGYEKGNLIAENSSLCGGDEPIVECHGWGVFNGNSYFNLGFTSNINQEYEIELISSVLSCHIFGSRTSASAQACGMFMGVNAGYRFSYGATLTNTFVLNAPSQVKVGDNIVVHWSSTKWNAANKTSGTSYNGIPTTFTEEATELNDNYLGAINQLGTNTTPLFSGKIKYFKVWENGELIHSYYFKVINGETVLYDAIGDIVHHVEGEPIGYDDSNCQ